MSNPAIAVLPYGQSLGPALSKVATDTLIWPLGCPSRLQGACVGDMSASDHLIVFPKTMTHFALRRGTRAQISLILGEPSAIHAKHLALLRVTWRRFFRVLTFNQDLLERIPNGVFFPLGTTWVPEWREIKPEKTAMCSLIASAKRDSAGHKLRHDMVRWVRDTGQAIDVMGRGYTPFERKADGLAPYRFSIVIENMRETNYFSEKLVDAVLCNTVPIYWGCPNLDRFIDTSGVIQCASEADLRAAVAEMSAERYAELLPGLLAAQPQLEPYLDLERRAAEAIRALL